MLAGLRLQNNVLELWSLFDFLMPGLLGTSKQFNETYSKPITASRDAKSSSREQEAGMTCSSSVWVGVPIVVFRPVADRLSVSHDRGVGHGGATQAGAAVHVAARQRGRSAGMCAARNWIRRMSIPDCLSIGWAQDLPPKIIQDIYCDISDLQRALYEDFSNAALKGDIEATVKEMSTAVCMGLCTPYGHVVWLVPCHQRPRLSQAECICTVTRPRAPLHTHAGG